MQVTSQARGQGKLLKPGFKGEGRRDVEERAGGVAIVSRGAVWPLERLYSVHCT